MRKATLTLILATVFIGGYLSALAIPAAYAQVTNTVAVTVSNEIVRPMSEDLRGTYYYLLSIRDTYGAQLNTLFPAGGGTIEDGRENVTPITADDARKILLFANTFINAYESEGVAAMTKSCVRPMVIN